MPEDKSALFVRIPTATAKKLETHAKRAGRSKQDIVATLITAGLQKPSVSSSAGSVVPIAAVAPEVTDILTLDELSAYLRIDREELEKRLQTQEIPARRFGSEWRFSREAINRWMEGTDRPTKRQTGFGRSE
jgi:excisionase family DNA binding protein